MEQIISADAARAYLHISKRKFLYTIIQKSQRGVFVKFFVNDIDKQPSFDKILRYKGRFLKIYNYRQDDDKMAALHAKVISVDQQQTLITLRTFPTTDNKAT